YWYFKTKLCLLILAIIDYHNAEMLERKSRPNIIFILADDLGFNDLGFHGSSQIPTPNIDALAYSGLILNRYYVTPICTPSRSALMTGKYPIHTGMQHGVIYGAEPRGLPLTEKILPEYLNQLGYSSHISGKWHLGHYKSVYLPLKRGFKTHVGFWTGHHDYFDHTAVENPHWGLDMRDGYQIGYEYHGKYTTDVVTDEAVRVIKAHNSTKPLFLYVAHAAVHSGNPYNPLPAPDQTVAKLKHIPDFKRRKYAAMLSKLDDSVGEIINTLSEQNMLKNSIIVFSTDNGGPAQGFNLNYASNWPLRGVKNTLWEGGVRGAGLIWSPLIEKSKRVSDQIMHIVDWVPTFLDAAGFYEFKNLTQPSLDGISVWSELSRDLKSKRKDILHNIDDIWGSAAYTADDWKVVVGTNYDGQWDGWYGPSGNRDDLDYNINEIYKSLSGRAINKLHMMPTMDEIKSLRKNAQVDCSTVNRSYLRKGTVCEPLSSPCLFNIKDDPCEQYNLAEIFPSILKSLLKDIERYNATAIPPNNKPRDPKGDPRLWDNTWTNFGDYEFPQSEKII
ncbi:arylsulfatase J, partial [Condylostylus longicornis]|uniref:arylsulfatase J n=1 Tax=Condylostylus longicornis TaxID=2530218 RepID=UPI00244DCF22